MKKLKISKMSWSDKIGFCERISRLYLSGRKITKEQQLVWDKIIKSISKK